MIAEVFGREGLVIETEDIFPRVRVSDFKIVNFGNFEWRMRNPDVFSLSKQEEDISLDM